MFMVKRLGQTIIGLGYFSAVLMICSQTVLPAQTGKDDRADPADVFSFNRVVTSVAFAPDGLTFVTGGGIYPNHGEFDLVGS